MIIVVKKEQFDYIHWILQCFEEEKEFFILRAGANFVMLRLLTIEQFEDNVEDRPGKERYCLRLLLEDQSEEFGTRFSWESDCQAIMYL